MRSAFALRIVSGRTILNFGVQKRLRAFLNPIFTDGVVTENGICSAAFCESAVLREKGSPSQSSPVGLASSPKGRAFGTAEKFPGVPAPLGGAVAQRLRGYKSAEPENTVKRSSVFSGAAHPFGVKRGE